MSAPENLLIREQELRKLIRKQMKHKNILIIAAKYCSTIIINNYHVIIIGIIIIAVLVILYNKKKTEVQLNKFTNKLIVEDENPELHGGYEAEYYKMLPRVMPPPPETYDEEL